MRQVFPTLALAASAMALTGCGMSAADSPAHEARITLRVADAAMQAGAPDMALQVAELVLRQRPDDVPAMVAMANALYALGAPDQARAAYRQAVARDPNDAAAQIGLGRTLVRTDPPAAEAAFLAALGKRADDVQALNDLGIARDLQGHHEAAQLAYRQALTVAPDNADVRTNLGLSLALSGDGAQAVTVLRPVAAAPEATPMQRADLAVAMARPGAVPRQVAQDGPAMDAASRSAEPRSPRTLQAAPAAHVRIAASRGKGYGHMPADRTVTLARHASRSLVAAEGGLQPGPKVATADLATVKADASTGVAELAAAVDGGSMKGSPGAASPFQVVSWLAVGGLPGATGTSQPFLDDWVGR